MKIQIDEESSKKHLLEMLLRVKSIDTMDIILQELLTIKEYDDLMLRWRLLERLYLGQSQRKISSDLKISLCKITRGSKLLKDKTSVCRKYLKVIYD